MLGLRILAASFALSGFGCGVYLGHEALELAIEQRMEVADGLTPLERATNETASIYLLSGIGAACVASSTIVIGGMVKDSDYARHG